MTFPATCAASLVGCLLGTWLTDRTDMQVLIRFYRSVGHFGWRGPTARAGSAALAAQRADSCWLAVINVLLGCVVILRSHLSPTYLVGHWDRQSPVWFAAAVAAAIAIVVRWYHNLPAE